MNAEEPRDNRQRQQGNDFPTGFVFPPMGGPSETSRVYRHADDFGDGVSRVMIDHFTAALDKLRPDVRQALASRVQHILIKLATSNRIPPATRPASKILRLDHRPTRHWQTRWVNGLMTSI